MTSPSPPPLPTASPPWHSLYRDCNAPHAGPLVDLKEPLDDSGRQWCPCAQGVSGEYVCCADYTDASSQPIEDLNCDYCCRWPQEEVRWTAAPIFYLGPIFILFAVALHCQRRRRMRHMRRHA